MKTTVRKTGVLLFCLLLPLCLMLGGCAAETPSAAPDTAANTATADTPADAPAPASEILLKIGRPTLLADGVEKAIDSEGTAPRIIGGRTLLPVRAVVEAMGGTVDWNGTRREVTLRCGETELKLYIDRTDVYRNGEKTVLDTAPIILGGRTMLPIRAIAESFGFTVEWAPETQTVTLKREEAAVPGAKEIRLTVGDRAFAVEPADTAAAKNLIALLSAGDIPLDLSDYGGFEKVGDLPAALPADDAQTTTAPGDVVLYQGNKIVVFYGENTWSYTRLGRIKDVTADDLKAVLGTGDVTAVLSAKDLPAPAEKTSAVVFFSCTNNTRSLAEKIAAAGNLRYEYFLPLADSETVLLIDAWKDQAAPDAHHASPLMAEISALREKYDLHMRVERCVPQEENAADARFIRK